MKHSWNLGLITAFAVAATASAQDARIEQVGPPPAPPPPTAEALAAPLRPDWIRMPTDRQLSDLSPAKIQKGFTVTVRLRCVAAASGRLESCKVVDETPPPRGFAEAAVAAARYYQMRPRSRDNVPVAGREVHLEVVWKQTLPLRPSP